MIKILISQSQDFRFLWLPKTTITRRKKPMGCGGDGYENKFYVKIIDKLYVIIHDRIR